MRTFARLGLQSGVVVVLLATAICLSPNIAGAQVPPVNCKERPVLNNVITQCVVDTATFPAGCAVWCPSHGPFLGCWPTLDDAVNAPLVPWEPLLPPYPHVPPDPLPARTIGVFGRTVEAVAFKAPGFCGALAGRANVLIHDAPPPPVCVAGWPAPGPYPLVIEECHDAKIADGSGGALPVIRVLNATPAGPVGPVTINGLEVIGGRDGIQVDTTLNPTVLKAIDAHGAVFAGIWVRGDDNEVSGSVTDNNFQDGIQVDGDRNLIRSNRARANLRDGLSIGGDFNHVTGNTADNNLDDGFDIRGDFNLIKSSNRTRNNGRSGFYVPGTQNTLRGNEARTNGEIEFNIPGLANRLDSNNAWDTPLTICYVAPTSGGTGNKANGENVTLPAPLVPCP